MKDKDYSQWWFNEDKSAQQTMGYIVSHNTASQDLLNTHTCPWVLCTFEHCVYQTNPSLLWYYTHTLSITTACNYVYVYACSE